LLDVDITGARSALIHITGGEELSLKSAKTIMKTVAERLDPSAKIIWGARLDESMGQSTRVMLIATCLKSTKPSTSEIEIALKERPVFRGNGDSAGDGEPEEVQSVAKSDASPMDKSSMSKKVFSEIFVEEAETDIVVMEEAARNLVTGSHQDNEKSLTEIKNACSSIYSSAELFDYAKISEFAELFGELLKDALGGKFHFSHGVVDLLQQIPPALRTVIEHDDNDQALEEVMCKITNVLDLVSGAKGEDITADLEEALADSAGTSAEQGEPTGSPASTPAPDYSNVKEAVKYFDKLF
ncbi:MAG: hypothetical protein ACE5G1_15490, partial [bacterium]